MLNAFACRSTFLQNLSFWEVSEMVLGKIESFKMEPVDLTLKLTKHCRNRQHLPLLIKFCLDQLFEKLMILKTVRFSYPLNFLFPQGFEEISKKVLAKIGSFLNEPVALMLEFTKHCRKRQNSHFLLNFFLDQLFVKLMMRF